MTFHVGQKVVCVDASEASFGRKSRLIQGDRYTIRAVFEFRGDTGVLLDEVDPGSSPGWYATRFRSVVERETDIAIFQAMLSPL